MEPLNYDKLEECRQTIKNVKALLLDAVMAEIKRTEVGEWDFDTVISAHYPHSGSILVHNIETLSIDGSSVVCGCSIGDPGSQERELITCDLSVFDCETILEALTQLRKELRELRLTVLKDVVRSHGGSIKFDGSFTFIGDVEDRSNELGEPCEDCRLTELRIVNDKLEVLSAWQGGNYDNTENFIPDYELDRIVSYAKQQPSVNVSLTEEQRCAVEDLKAAFQKLADLDVGYVYETDYGLLEFFNKRDIEEYEFFYSGQGDKGGGFIDVQNQLDDECESIEDIGYYNAFNNERLFVKPKS